MVGHLVQGARGTCGTLIVAACALVQNHCECQFSVNCFAEEALRPSNPFSEIPAVNYLLPKGTASLCFQGFMARCLVLCICFWGWSLVQE